MKTIKFDARFKEEILNKEKVATIRNSKKVDVGEVFEIVICSGEPELSIKAECVGVLKLKTRFLIGALERQRINGFYARIQYNYPLTPEQFGFKDLKEALENYNPYLKNEHCYLHIFELIEG